MEIFLSSLVGGLAFGCIYGLIGVSFNAIYNVCHLVNFAQGHFAMLAILSWFYMTHVFKMPLPIALVASIIFVPVLFGISIQYLVAEPLVRAKRPIVSLVIATLGAGLCSEGIGGILTGFRNLFIYSPLGYETVKLGGIYVFWNYILIFGCTALLCFVYWLFLEKTKLGLQLRAAGIDDEMAALEGVNLVKIRSLAWIISATICAIAGWLVAPFIQATVLVGLSLVINGFVAAAIGGFASSFGPLLGGILMGLIVSFSYSYIQPGLGELIMFMGLIGILIFRPHGLVAR
ncbi:MAG: branched-chain amino acid ABC transporter permease [Candidatus Hodarchaeota archaeon]